MLKPGHRQCEGIAKNGQRCRSFCVDGADYCMVHDPASAGRMERIRALPKKRKAPEASQDQQVEALTAQIKSLRSTDDLAAVNAGLVVAVLTGKVKPDAARAAVSALLAQRHFIVDKARERTILKLIEKHEQNTRKRIA